MFFNSKAEKDYQIILNVVSGSADLYMSTYEDPEDLDESNTALSASASLSSKLPKSKRDALLVLENVTPKVSTNERFLLILNNDRSYCT